MKIRNTTIKTLVAGLGLVTTTSFGQSSIFDIVANSPEHTILETALIQQGLNTTLSDSSINYTLFAPTDSAFNAYFAASGTTAPQLLANSELTNILLHHVIGSEVFSSALTNGEVETLNGLDVTVNLTGGAKIDSAGVLTADLDASNGVVHSIGYVLLPTYDDVTEIVVKSSNHTTLFAALQQANLVATLQDLSKSYTVFAPTNAAFDQYFLNSGTTAQQLLASPELSNILLHHVLGSTVLSTGLSNGEVSTLNGRDVTVNLTAGVKIDSANVTTADLRADNGVVHVLDYVLLPTYDDVTEIVTGSADHTTLLAALQQANLVATLQDLSKSYTVFAPTNAAFDVFLNANNLTVNDLLSAPNLSNILLHHVLGVKALSTGLVSGPVNTLNTTAVTITVGAGVKVDSANVTVADLSADNGVVHVIDGVLVLPTATNVAALSSPDLKVFPNPAQAYIIIEGITSNDLVQIFDVEGKLVKNDVLILNSLDISDLPAGRYIIRSTSSQSVSFVKK